GGGGQGGGRGGGGGGDGGRGDRGGGRGDRAALGHRGQAGRRHVLVRAERCGREAATRVQARALLPPALPRRPLRRPGRRARRRTLVLACRRRGRRWLRQRAGAGPSRARAARDG